MKVREARESLEVMLKLARGEDPGPSPKLSGEKAQVLIEGSLETAIHALKKIEAEMGNVEFLGVDNGET